MSGSVLAIAESVLMFSGIEEKNEESAVLPLGFLPCLLWFDAFTNKRTVVLNGMTGMTMKGNEKNVNGASGE